MSLKKDNIIKITIITLVLVFFGLYFFNTNINYHINSFIMMFTDLEKVQEFVRSYGPYAMAISFILMVLQAVIPPIPAFVITLTNAALFGWVQGAILSWSSAMVAAALCFYLAKLFGRDIVVRFFSEKLVNESDKFFNKYGSKTILITRLLPFISFDLISYVGGLTSIKFRNFMIATGIGQLPATIIYSYVGGQISGGAQKLFIGLLALFILVVLAGLFRQIYVSRTKIDV